MRACSNSWKPSTSRRSGDDGVEALHRQPLGGRHAGRKGTDLATIAMQTGRTTLARKDVDSYLSGGPGSSNVSDDSR